MFSEKIFRLFELRKFLKKKLIFPPQFKILNKIFLLAKIFLKNIFFQFYFPNCLSHKILFFLSNWKIFLEKKGKKNATENYFSGIWKKRFFFLKNRINHYIKIPVIFGKTYSDRKKVPKNEKNLKKIDFLLKKMNKIAIFFIIRAENHKFEFQKSNLWKSVCRSQMSKK